MAFILGRGFVDMELDDDKVNKGLTKFQGRLRKFEAGLTRWVKRLGVVLGGGIAAALGFSVKQAAKSAEAQAKLAAVLKATGNAAGFTVEQLKAQADELENLAEVEDDVVTNTQAILATFKEIRGPIFTQAITAIADMSAVIGQDMRQGAIQLGKALNDPIRGVTALRRVGVSFTAQQIEQIKVLTESGDIMAAQAIILKELQTEFGGAAKRIAEAGTGFKSLMNIVKDTGEAFADPLLKYLREVNTELGILFDSEKARKWGESLRDVIVGLRGDGGTPSQVMAGPATAAEREQAHSRMMWTRLRRAWGLPDIPSKTGEVSAVAKGGMWSVIKQMFGGPEAWTIEGGPAGAGTPVTRMAAAATAAEVAKKAADVETRRRPPGPPPRGIGAAVAEGIGLPPTEKLMGELKQINLERLALEKQMAEEQKVFTPGFASLDEGFRMLSTTAEKADDKKIGLMEKQLKKLDDLKGLYEAFLNEIEAGPKYN